MWAIFQPEVGDQPSHIAQDMVGIFRWLNDEEVVDVQYLQVCRVSSKLTIFGASARRLLSCPSDETQLLCL